MTDGANSPPNARSRRRPASITSLADLRLTDRELIDLARQGSVSCEYRRDHRPYFKLRLRSEGRQVVRYVGNDIEIANRLQVEVANLQADRRLERQARQLTAVTFREIRASKKMLSEILANVGFHFHGFAIREMRSRRTCENVD